MIDTTVWEFNHLDENTYNNLEGNTYDEKLKTFRFLEKQKREEESIAHFQNVCDLLYPSQDITLNINLDISNIDQPVAQTTKEEAIAEQGAQAGITNEDNEDNHAFMQIMKCEHPAAYTAMKNGLKAKIIEYKQGYFNFKCDKGCVGLVFNEAGYTAYKQIVRYIFINGEEAKEITLRNCKSNAEPKEWEKIKPFFFQ